MTLQQLLIRRMLRVPLPYLVRCDVTGLTEMLRRDWPLERIEMVIRGPDVDATKIAIVCLGLVGRMENCPVLQEMLHHYDPFVAWLAEHAMWCIWFRSGDPRLDAHLISGVKLIGQERYLEAEKTLSRLIDRAPDFAEAWYQRAVARCLAGDYARCAADCEQAIRRNPTHFGAWASLGYSLAQNGEYDRALRCYYEAMKIHPRLSGVRQAIRCLRNLVRRGGATTFTDFRPPAPI